MIDVADSNTVYYYHFDGLGSVIALSNVNGEIVERYSYDVFGEPNRTTDVNNPYLFTGRRYDNESGLYYYRARYYSADIGRFLQPDPIPALNLYAYCGNNPINLIDPSGLLVTIGPYGPHWWPPSSLRPPSNFEMEQINNVINDLKNTGDLGLIRIADSLRVRTYVIDTSVPWAWAYAKPHVRPNTIYLNPESITYMSGQFGVRDGLIINKLLMYTMIHEDWHLLSAYHVDSHLGEYILSKIPYEDHVHKYIGRYLEQIWKRYIDGYKRAKKKS